jgi:AcrR family transcriptional regulator
MAAKDRRFRKTEKVIFDAMVRLLNETTVDQLQIRDLITEADINKSTFYLHYQSLDAILATLEDDLVSKIRSSFNPVCELSEFPRQLDSLLAELKHQRKLGYAVFSSSSRIWDKLLAVYEYDNPLSETSSINKKIFDRPSYLFSSFIDGIFSSVSKWILDGAKIKPEEIKAYCLEVFTSDLYHPIFS